MERIKRSYAIIYIDRLGISLNEDSYTIQEEIRNDYYKNPGFLQWNYYLIIGSSKISKDKKFIIENNEFYTKKYVIHPDKIDKFISDNFPIFDEKKHGKVRVIIGDSWKDAKKEAKKEQEKENGILIPSFFRNESSLKSLTEMDKIRINLIKNQEYNVIFYTHLTDEYFLASKKFKLFM